MDKNILTYFLSIHLKIRIRFFISIFESNWFFGLQTKREVFDSFLFVSLNDCSELVLNFISNPLLSTAKLNQV